MFPFAVGRFADLQVVEADGDDERIDPRDEDVFPEKVVVDAEDGQHHGERDEEADQAPDKRDQQPSDQQIGHLISRISFMERRRMGGVFLDRKWCVWGEKK